jgi:hypothetical protein
MEYGDRDGLNKVYTPEGQVLLNEDEEILVQEDSIPQLMSTWRTFGGDYLLNPSEGEFILTNQRLIYLANLESNITRIHQSSTTVTAPSHYAMKMKSVHSLKNIDEKEGIRDFFEIPVKEIIACTINSGLVSGGHQIYAYILSKGEQYHLTFIAIEGSDLLRRFQQNQVDNVDELTKNLKDYFENTDWIYVKEEGGDQPSGFGF